MVTSSLARVDAALTTLASIGLPIGTGWATASLHGERVSATTGEGPAPTAFDLGSTAKAITALTLLRLAERGDLTLTDTVADSAAHTHLPDLWAHISLADLARHQAQIPNLPPNLTGPLWDPCRGFDEPQLQEGMRRIVRRRPDVDYSNFGYAVLRSCIEQVAESDLNTLMHRLILPALGAATPSVSPHPIAGLPQGYEASGTAADPWAFRAMYGAGGLYGTLDDLIALGVALSVPGNRVHDTLTVAWRSDTTTAHRPSLTWGWVSRQMSKARVSWIAGETSVSTSLLMIHHNWRVVVAFCANRGGIDDLLPTGMRCLKELVDIVAH